jgi:hypothetical protein
MICNLLTITINKTILAPAVFDIVTNKQRIKIDYISASCCTVFNTSICNIHSLKMQPFSSVWQRERKTEEKGCILRL